MRFFLVCNALYLPGRATSRVPNLETVRLTKVGVGAPALVRSKGWRSNRLHRFLLRGFHLRVHSGNEAIKTDETLDRRVSQDHLQFGANKHF